MPKNTTINLRVDSEVKEQAGEILASLGMTLSEAFNLLLHQVRIVRGLPFEIKQGMPPYMPAAGYPAGTGAAGADFDAGAAGGVLAGTGAAGADFGAGAAGGVLAGTGAAGAAADFAAAVETGIGASPAACTLAAAGGALATGGAYADLSMQSSLLSYKPWSRKEAKMDNEIIKSVAGILNHKPDDIQNIHVLDKGMTNRAFTFTCGGVKYILRVPGEGTGELINRKDEYVSYQKVMPLGICDDVVHIDPETGYKITVFWENARVCDPFNADDVAMCMKALRDLHELKLVVPHNFDIRERTEFYQSLLTSGSCFFDHAETTANINRLADWTDSLEIPKSLTHIDAVPDNFMLLPVSGKEEIRLLDWEYAGMADPHVDIAMFAVYAMYEREHVEKLIDCYFFDGCPELTRRKIYAYIAMCGLLWSNWCEYKRQHGVEFGEYALKQYYYAKEYYAIWENGESGICLVRQFDR